MFFNWETLGQGRGDDFSYFRIGVEICQAYFRPPIFGDLIQYIYIYIYVYPIWKAWNTGVCAGKQ